MLSTLCWSSHSSVLASALDSLYDSPDTSDLHILCQGRNISVHRLVLAAASPFLAGLLQDGHTTLSLDGITYSQVSHNQSINTRTLYLVCLNILSAYF